MEVRCSQDCNDELYLGKKNKRDLLLNHLPQIDIDNIKTTISKLRDKRGGTFWVNISEGYIIVMKEGMKCRSDDNTHHSIRRKDIVYQGEEPLKEKCTSLCN